MRQRAMSIKFARQSGISLIELILFIIIVGVGIAGILMTFNVGVRGSADPMVRKQAIAIAESLLLEIEQQAFTWCDPQDANVLTAVSAAGCAVAGNDQNKAGTAFPVPPAAPAPTPATEVRGAPGDPYDNVADYAAFQALGSDIVGGNASATYTASVSISRVGATAVFAAVPALPVAPGIPPDAALRIAVRVTGGGEDITLVGYRFRYAPNAPG